MTTTVTHTLKASGGDYSTFNAWQNAQKRDLVALDEIAQLECYDFQLVEAPVEIYGWTTGPNNYVRIYVAAGQGHNGLPRELTGIGFEIKKDPGAGNYNAALYIAQQHTRIEGLCINGNGAGGYDGGLMYEDGYANDGPNEHFADKCIVYSPGAELVPASQALFLAIAANLNLTVRNTAAFWETQGLTVYCDGPGAVTKLINCVVHGLSWGVASNQGSANLTIKNTYAYGASLHCFHNCANATGSNNASSNGEAGTFPNSLTGISPTVQFVDPDNGDFTLKEGSDLELAGIPVVGVTEDLAGNVRDAVSPDIGCMEFQPTYQIMRPISDITTTGWVDQTGGSTNLYQAIGEERRRDAGYIRSPLNPSSSIAKFRLSSADEPAVDTDHIVRVSYKKISTQHVDLIVRIKVGATLIWTKTYTDIHEAFFESDEELTTMQAAALAGNYGIVDVEMETTSS